MRERVKALLAPSPQTPQRIAKKSGLRLPDARTVLRELAADKEAELQPEGYSLPWPLSAAIYDMSVSHGTVDEAVEPGATHMLQQALLRALKGTPLQQALAACDAREAYYHGIVRNRPASAAFLKGWLRRLNALRAWLKANAAPLPEPVPALPPQRLWLVPKGGGDAAAWNGRDNPYGGNTLGPELLAVLDLAYPTPGGPCTYGNLKVWRRNNYTFVLERA